MEPYDGTHKVPRVAAANSGGLFHRVPEPAFRAPLADGRGSRDPSRDPAHVDAHFSGRSGGPVVDDSTYGVALFVPVARGTAAQGEGTPPPLLHAARCCTSAAPTAGHPDLVLWECDSPQPIRVARLVYVTTRDDKVPLSVLEDVALAQNGAWSGCSTSEVAEEDDDDDDDLPDFRNRYVDAAVALLDRAASTTNSLTLRALYCTWMMDLALEADAHFSDPVRIVDYKPLARVLCRAYEEWKDRASTVILLEMYELARWRLFPHSSVMTFLAGGDLPNAVEAS